MGSYCIYQNNLNQTIKKNEIDVNYLQNPTIFNRNTNQNENGFQSLSTKVLQISKKNINYNNINNEEKSENKSSIKQSVKAESFDKKIKPKRKHQSEKKLTKTTLKNKPKKSSFSVNNLKRGKPILSYLEQRAKEKEKLKKSDKHNKLK